MYTYTWNINYTITLHIKLSEIKWKNKTVLYQSRMSHYSIFVLLFLDIAVYALESKEMAMVHKTRSTFFFLNLRVWLLSLFFFVKGVKCQEYIFLWKTITWQYFGNLWMSME